MSRVTRELERKWLESATCLLIFQGQFQRIVDSSLQKCDCVSFY